MTQAVAVIRVSTDDQARSGLGLEAQMAAVEGWCTREGVELLAVFREAGVSGATPLEQRHGLQSALSLLLERKARYLVVATRDRLSRDPMVSAMVDKTLRKHGASVAAADGLGNGSAPADVLVRAVVDGVAAFERAMTAERTSKALRARQARGQYVGRAPYGHRYENGQLVEDAGEQLLIEQIMGLHRQGLPLREVAASLLELGITNRSGGRWHPTQIRRVLERR